MRRNGDETISRGAGHGLFGFVRASLAAIGPDRERLALLILMATLSGAVQSVLLFVLGLIGIALSSPEALPDILRLPNGEPLQLQREMLVPLAGGLTLAVLLLAYPLARLQASINARAVQRARLALIQAFLRASADSRQTHKDGYFQQLLVDQAQYLSVTVQFFVSFCIGGVTLTVLLVVPALLNYKIGGAVIVALAGSMIVLRPALAWVGKDVRRRSIVNRELSTYTGQVSRLADDIEAFHVGKAVAARMGERIRASAEALRRLSFNDSIVPTLYQFGSLGALVAAIGVMLAVYPGRHPGVAVTALLILRALGYGRQVLASLQQGRAWAPHVEQVLAEIDRLEHSAKPPSDRTPASFTGIEARAVSFAYPGGKQVLRDASFDIAPGDAVGIAGPSGGGKSTLCGLLLGLREPTSGTVTLGGVPVREIDADAWARLFAYVPQDCKLLTGSVADNIRFFRDGFGQADVEAAARAAHIDAEIERLPQGYETIVGPGAAGLSGGQRQRLVLARALLARPQLLILDEPSSALDKVSEKLVGQTLKELKGTTTLVIVAHRAATLAVCDRIFRIADGRLVEDPA